MSAVAVTALAGGGIMAVQPAHAAPALPPALPGAAAAESSLRAAAGQPPTIRKDRSGVVRTVTAKPGHPLRRPAGATPETAARGFLKAYGAAFGLRDGGAGLKTLRTDRTKDGDRITRFAQHVGGLPVIGGEIVVVTEPTGELIGATSEVSQDTSTSGTGRLTEQEAVSQAVAVVRRGAKGAELSGSAEKFMYDPAMIGAPGRGGLRPVWQVDVTPASDPDLAKQVLIDANTGGILLVLDKHKHFIARIVCDWNNTAAPVSNPSTGERDPYCDSRNTTRAENGAPTSVVDVNNAYDYAGATYDYFWNNFGRDSIDGKGMPLRSSVRACPEAGLCPYPNAYWDGTKMVYGEGFASADDVVAHELTHGVTEHTSNLVYAYQSGAINEALSDIFGELIDQAYPGGQDGASYDWKLGEDLPPSIGVIRDMANPPAYEQPDKMTSPLYYATADEWGQVDDNGGVHTNSGIGNKAAFLLARSGSPLTFNSVTVAPLGPVKTGHVFYRTQSLLTSGSDYADLAAALDSSCQQLASAGTAGVTVEDCAQVRNATAAVEMTKQPTVPNAPVADAPLCTGDAAASVSRTEDMENPAAGRWLNTTPNWLYLSAANNGGQGYAHGGKVALYGESRVGSEPGQPADPRKAFSSTQLATPISVATDKPTYVWFAHSHWFDTYQGQSFDGGRVEFRVNGGAWGDAGASGLITHNRYQGPIQPDAKAPAGTYFTGDSRGYTSTRLDLTKYAGSKVDLRFTIYGDDTIASYWLIDDLKVFSCTGTSQAGPVRGLRGGGEVGGVTLSWYPSAATAPVTGYEITATPAVTGLPRVVPAGTIRSTITGLSKTSAYKLTVRPKFGETLGDTAAVNIAKAASITLSASPGTVVYPGKVTVKGQITGYPTTGFKGGVKIWTKPRNSGVWTHIATVLVGTTGAYSYAAAPSINSLYTVHYVGGENVQGINSGVVGANVAPAVTIVAPSSARRSTTVRFTGGTNPPRRSVPFYLQVYSAGAWRTVGSGTTYYAASYAVSYRLPASPGRYSYRIVVNGDANYAGGTSPTKVITVT